METRIIETTNGGNWGKFLLGRFTSERDYRSALPAAEGALPAVVDLPNVPFRLTGYRRHGPPEAQR